MSIKIFKICCLIKVKNKFSSQLTIHNTFIPQHILIFKLVVVLRETTKIWALKIRILICLFFLLVSGILVFNEEISGSFFNNGTFLRKFSWDFLNGSILFLKNIKTHFPLLSKFAEIHYLHTNIEVWFWLNFWRVGTIFDSFAPNYIPDEQGHSTRS